ncbi:MAG: creatininase family protein, partial [Synergistales bacterium]|nr:creatininase family protein [Synergistales bacterium]
MQKVLLEEMSWTEARDALARSDLVIVPVGSLEEHGPHNPLGTDFIIAREAARLVGERVGAPVTPVLPLGYCLGLTGFPGTVSIDPELFRRLVFSLCEGLVRWGARRFLFVNGHGGNTAILNVVALDLRKQYGAVAASTQWWHVLAQMNPEWPCNGHGDKFETSMNLAVCPQ